MNDFTLSANGRRILNESGEYFSPSQIQGGLFLGEIGNQKFAALRESYIASMDAYMTAAEKAEMFGRVAALHAS